VAAHGGGFYAGGVPDDVRVNDRLTIPAAELSWRFSRSSGPGGQGVNTTDSRVELSWDLAGSEVLPLALRDRALERLRDRLVNGVLTVTASEHRSQLRNREAAAARLAGIVASAIAPPPRVRRPTRPSRGAVERRIAEKKRRGEIKRNRRASPGD
jgi:ribosome-associated protein